MAYEITGKRVGSSQWTTLLQSNVFDYSNVFGLQPGFSYHWTVRAWCDSAGNITSPWAGLDTFTTLPFSPVRHSEGGTTEESGWQWQQNSTRSFANTQDDGVGWADDEFELQVFPNPFETTTTVQIPATFGKKECGFIT